MKKDLVTIPGTIAYVFNQHNAEFNQCTSWQQMKALALKLLDTETFTDKEAVRKAKNILTQCAGSKFMSTLVTYMTGAKV